MKHNTVRLWIIRYIVILLFPLFLIILVMFSYMISGISARSVELSEKTMQLYISQLEESIRNMERILATLYDNNIDLSYLCVSEDQNQMYMSKIAFTNYLNRELLVCDRFDGMFVVVDRADEEIYIGAGNDSNSIIKTEILNLINGDDTLRSPFLVKWNICRIKGRSFLLRLVRSGNNYCGAWIHLDSMAECMKEACDISEAEAVVTDCQDMIVSVTAFAAKELVQGYQEEVVFVSDHMGRDYTVSNAEMSDGLLKFYLFVPTGILLKEVRVLRNIFGMIVIFIIVLLAVFWRKIRERIIEPCVELSSAMEHIETEEELLLKQNDLLEFDQTRQGFNRMKRQIRTLKIQSYEQKLREQKIHMQYLFGQIQPHFFLNTLNVLYSFAEIERYDLIQKLVLAMVKYLRYVFNNGSKPVMLREELAHVEDFITIQQLRYPDRILYRKEVESSMDQIKVLPCLMQTFVENSIKYGLCEDGVNEICVRATLSGDKVCITVSDTGKGFTEEQMREINAGVDDEDSIYRIGIRNTRQRLKLLYGESAEIRVENRKEGGAGVSIWFPTESGKEEE